MPGLLRFETYCLRPEASQSEPIGALFQPHRLINPEQVNYSGGVLCIFLLLSLA